MSENKSTQISSSEKNNDTVSSSRSSSKVTQFKEFVAAEREKIKEKQIIQADPELSSKTLDYQEESIVSVSKDTSYQDVMNDKRQRQEQRKVEKEETRQGEKKEQLKTEKKDKLPQRSHGPFVVPTTPPGNTDKIVALIHKNSNNTGAVPVYVSNSNVSAGDEDMQLGNPVYQKSSSTNNSNNCSGGSSGSNSYNYNNPSDCYLFQYLPSGAEKNLAVKNLNDFQAYVSKDFQNTRNAANRPSLLNLELSKLDEFAQCRQISPQDKLTLAQEIYRLDAVRQDALQAESLMKQLYKEEIVKHSKKHSLNPTQEHLKLALALRENEARYHTHSDKAIAMAEKIVKGANARDVAVIIEKNKKDEAEKIAAQESKIKADQAKEQAEKVAEQLKNEKAKEEEQKLKDLQTAQLNVALQAKLQAEAEAQKISQYSSRTDRSSDENDGGQDKISGTVKNKNDSEMPQKLSQAKSYFDWDYWYPSSATQAKIPQDQPRKIQLRRQIRDTDAIKKESIHCNSMPEKTADDLRHQLITSHHNDNKIITVEETAMIDFMLDAMVHAQNNMTVELAQAGLQAWSHAQQAQTDEEYADYVNKAKNCYNLMYYQKPGRSFMEEGRFVRPSQIDAMLQDCNEAIEFDKKYRSSNEQHRDTAYTQRLQKRQQVLLESKEQIRTGALIYREYQMSYTARGFMMANNINYAAFDGMKSTSFQHQLTQENLDIIESSVKIAEQSGFEPGIKEFAKHTCKLAASSQQLNQLAKIKEAVAVLNLNDTYARYLELAMFIAEVEGSRILGEGVYKGTTRALWKWSKFAYNLAFDTEQTVNKIANDCLVIGNILLDGLQELGEHSILAHWDDFAQDLLQDMHETGMQDSIPSRKRRTEIRNERNRQAIKNGYEASLKIAQQVIINMASKTPEENIADVTEFLVDSIITSNITEGIFYLSKIAGNKLIMAGTELLENVPSSMINEPMQFMATSGGNIIAVVAETGENIGVAASVQVVLNRAEKFAQNLVQGKILADKVNKLTNPNKEEIAKLSKELEIIREATEIINIERLKAIPQEITQVDNFRIATNNFNPTLVAQLKPEEILYLNLCDWLYPKSIEINARIKNIGLTIIDPNNKNNIIYIEDLDIFHSFLGDMKPGSIADATSGGHCFLSELKGATLAVEEIIPFKNGFFDMRIRHLKGEGKFRPKTYFPSGKNIEQCADMIIDVIKKPQFIENITGARDINQSVFKVIDSYDQTFCLRITNGVVKCYPLAF